MCFLTHTKVCVYIENTREFDVAGEHGEWCKHTNFELATHAPMMVHIPGKTDSGVVSEELTEYVDLFPTLVDAAGLPPMPLCPRNSSQVALCREGTSLMPLIDAARGSPGGGGDGASGWKKRVFSQYPRGGGIMGYSMRTARYRYTEWVKFDHKTYTPDWSKSAGVELYDHDVDPEENHNVASKAGYKTLVAGLSKMLHTGWRSSQGQ